MACCEENNNAPPTVNFDFDSARVEKHAIYLTAFGTPCRYMNLIPEDAFITPSGSEETELSSDESIASKDSSIKSIPIPSSSTSVKKTIKIEKLSDSESISKSKDSSKSKSKSKSSKKSSPKTKKWSGVVEYSESDDSGDDKHKPRRRRHSIDSEEDRSKSRRKKEYITKTIKEEDIEEEEFKHTPGLSAAFGNYHCQVCDIVVNSEVTYQTHLQGKRHQKALKAKAVPEVAIQSLNEPRLPPPLAGIPNAPIRRTRRITVREESMIQLVAEDYKEGPLPGLSEVIEVRPAEGDDITYNCNLCEAKCVPNSIMKHLTGFKHYLKCLEKIDNISYERYRFNSKKAIEGKVRRILLDYEKRRGRGLIRVEQEVDDQYSTRSDVGPCWRDSTPSLAPSLDGFDDAEFVSAMEHLDTSMSDFYCKACDAHMNNKAMWESHVRGKRHLKNIKKEPGESTSKIKSYHCPDEPPHLLRLLDELDGTLDEFNKPYIFVGLDFIKETQGEAGDLYNCFLCGACTSSYDVVEHLHQVKHKIKYLEAMNAKGQDNSIENIKCLSDVSAYSKECMIDEECRMALQRHGEGKVSVYKSKNIYAPSTYGSHSSRY